MPLTKELLAPTIVIKWDPVSDNGTIRLDFMEFILDDNGSPTAYTNPKDIDVHFLNISDLYEKQLDLGENYVDPVTQESLPSNISGSTLMFGVKRLVDVLIKERKFEKAKTLLSYTRSNNNTEVTLDFSESSFINGDSFVELAVDWGDGSAPVTSTNMIVTHDYNVEEFAQFTVSITVKTVEFDSIELEDIVVGVAPPVEEEEDEYEEGEEDNDPLEPTPTPTPEEEAPED